MSSLKKNNLRATSTAAVIAALTVGFGVAAAADAQTVESVCLSVDVARDSLSLMPASTAMTFIRAAFEAEGVQVDDTSCGLALQVFHIEYGEQIEVHVVGDGIHEVAVALGPTGIVEAYRTVAARVIRPHRSASAPAASATQAAAPVSGPSSALAPVGTADDGASPTSALQAGPVSSERRQQIADWNRRRHVDESSFEWHPLVGLRFPALNGYSRYDYSYSYNPYQSPRMTLALGAAFRWNADQRRSWEADLEWAARGGVEGFGYGDAVGLTYLSMPLLARFRIGNSHNDRHFVVGPHASILMTKRYTQGAFLGMFPSYSEPIEDVRPVDVGFTLGGQIELNNARSNPLQRRELEFRFSRGLVPINAENGLRNVELAVYFRFFH